MANPRIEIDAFMNAEDIIKKANTIQVQMDRIDTLAKKSGLSTTAINKAMNEMGSGAANAAKTATMSWTDFRSMYSTVLDVVRVGQQVFAQTVTAAQDYDQTIKGMMASTGGTAEETSRLVQVMDDAGIKIDTVKKAMKEMAKDGNEPNIQTLAQLSDKFLTLNTGAERGKFLLDNFGKSGMEMARAMELGGAAILEMGNSVEEGLVLTNESIKASEQYRKNIDKLSDSFESAKVSLGNKLIPALNEALENYMGMADAMDKATDATGRTDQRSRILLGTMIAQRENTIAARDAVNAHADALDGFTESADGATLSLEEMDEVEKNIQKNNADMISGAIETQKAWDDEGKKLEDIKGKIVELEEQKAKLYPWETEKIQEINDKIEEQKQKYSESRDEFIAASQEKIAQAALEKIAMMDGIAGYSDAEAEMAKAVLENMGLASSAALEQQVAIDMLNNALVSGAIPSAQQYGAVLKQVMADGVMSIDEVNRAIAALPSNKTINVDVTTSGATGLLDMSFSSSGRTTPLGSGDEGAARRRNMKNHAIGGEFMIPMSYGNEGFRMGNGDTASGGERVTITPKGQAPAGFDMSEFARLVSNEMGRAIRDYALAVR